MLSPHARIVLRDVPVGWSLEVGSPWGGVGPGGPSLGQCGEFLSTAPPLATNPSRVLSIPEGRGRELPGPHFRHTTQNEASSSSVAIRR